MGSRVDIHLAEGGNDARKGLDQATINENHGIEHQPRGWRGLRCSQIVVHSGGCVDVCQKVGVDGLAA